MSWTALYSGLAEVIKMSVDWIPFSLFGPFSVLFILFFELLLVFCVVLCLLLCVLYKIYFLNIPGLGVISVKGGRSPICAFVAHSPISLLLQSAQVRNQGSLMKEGEDFSFHKMQWSHKVYPFQCENPCLNIELANLTFICLIQSTGHIPSTSIQMASGLEQWSDVRTSVSWYLGFNYLKTPCYTHWCRVNSFSWIFSFICYQNHTFGTCQVLRKPKGIQSRRNPRFVAEWLIWRRLQLGTNSWLHTWLH